MQHLELLAEALDYIEQHITEDIHTEDIAGACFCSRSSLEKIFRFVYHLSVRDYLVRRRMTKAARMLSEMPEKSILDVALMYGYSSHEAFTRSFQKVWNKLPSEYRDQTHVPELFPRLDLPRELGDESMTTKTFDISELYDLFQERNDCFFVVCDIQKLIPINEIDRKAGDLAILTSLNRMQEEAGPDDIVFRIGGDEFVILTSSREAAYAEELLNRILKKNGQCIVFEGKEIPLSLYGGIVKLKGKFHKYDELFTDLMNTIFEKKAEQKG